MPDIDIIIKATDRASGPIKNVDRALDGLDKNAGNMAAKGIGKLQHALGVGLKAATVVGIAAIGALGVALGSSLKASIDMEQAVADIMAVMGKAAPPVKELSDAILGLGLDPKLKVSAFEAADAIEMLAKNGITWQEIQGGMARSTILLANATNDDFALAADVATNAMVQFNKDASDMESVIDGIIGVTQASQFDINDYALAIAQAGGVAGSVGVEFEDFNAMLAATSSSFASGSDAGTSFKVFLQQLVPDTAKSVEAMRNLGLFSGLSAAEFDKLQGKINKTQAAIAELDPTSKNYAEKLDELTNKLFEQRTELVAGNSAFFDAEGSMKSAEEITAALSTAFTGLSDAERIAAASTIFGTDAMRTALALADAGEETVHKFKLAIGDTSAEEAAATRQDTLNGKWEIFLGKVEALSIMLGDVFKPAAKELVKWATDMAEVHGPKVIEWFQGLTNSATAFIALLRQGQDPLTAFRESFKDFIPAATMDAFNKIVGHIQSVIDVVGKAVGPFVTWKDVLNGLAVVLGTVVVTAIGGFLVAMAPVALVIGGAIAASALMRRAWEGNWGGIQEKTKVVVDYIRDTVVPAIGQLVTIVGSDMPIAFEDGSGKLMELLEVFGVSEGTAQNVGIAYRALVTLFGTDLPMAYEDGSGKLMDFLVMLGTSPELAQSVGGAFWDMKTAINDALTKAQEAVGTATMYIKDRFGPLGTTIRDFGQESLIEIIDWATGTETEFTATQTIWNEFRDTVVAVGDDIKTAFFGPNGAGTQMAKWLLKEFPAATAASIFASNELKAAFSDLIKTTEGSLGLSKAQMTTFTLALQDIIGKGLAIVITRMTTFVSNFGDLIKLMDATGRRDWEGMWAAIESIQDRGARTQLFEAAVWAGEMEAAFILAGEGSVSGFGEGIDARAQFGVGKVRGFGDDVKKDFQNNLELKSPSAVFSRYGANTIQGFIDGVGSMIGSASNKMLEVVNAVKGLFADPINWLYQKGVDAVQGFVNGVGSMIGAAQAKVTELGNLAALALPITLEEDSPSRRFHRYGEFAGLGFINGMNSMLGMARTKAAELAQVALDAAMKIVGIGDLLRDSEYSKIAQQILATGVYPDASKLGELKASDPRLAQLQEINDKVYGDAARAAQVALQAAQSVVQSVTQAASQMINVPKVIPSASDAGGIYSSSGNWLPNRIRASDWIVKELEDGSRALHNVLNSTRLALKDYTLKTFEDGSKFYERIGAVYNNAAQPGWLGAGSTQSAVVGAPIAAVASKPAFNADLINKVMSLLSKGSVAGGSPFGDSSPLTDKILALYPKMQQLLRDGEYYNIFKNLLTTGAFPHASQLGELKANDYRFAQVQELRDKIYDATGRGSNTNNFTVNVQTTGNAVQDIRNQVELYAMTFGAT